MPERLEIYNQIRSLDDGALRRLVFLESEEYLPEALEYARGELSSRRIPFMTPEEYWKQFPEEWMESRGFCYSCWMQTTDEALGDVMSINFIGVRLRGNEDPCSVCGSVVQSTWFCLIFPVERLATYRVILGPGGRYIGRKLKDQRGGRQE